MWVAVEIECDAFGSNAFRSKQPPFPWWGDLSCRWKLPTQL